MKKICITRTLAENFGTTIKNGQIIITQRCSDLNIAINILHDISEDVTTEEWKALQRAINILRKYDKEQEDITTAEVTDFVGEYLMNHGGRI